jgi:hypothetical protein
MASAPQDAGGCQTEGFSVEAPLKAVRGGRPLQQYAHISIGRNPNEHNDAAAARAIWRGRGQEGTIQHQLSIICTDVLREDWNRVGQSARTSKERERPHPGAAADNDTTALRQAKA